MGPAYHKGASHWSFSVQPLPEGFVISVDELELLVIQPPDEDS